MNHAPAPRNDLKEVRTRHRHALASGRPAVILASLADVPPLCEEVANLRLYLAIARLTRANLAAAARATLAATADQEKDPLSYLRDELTAQGILSVRHGERPW
jgi:hypothetical protein